MSNLFKRETLSGEFLQINAYLVRELQALGLWTEPVIAAIKRAEGSVQDIEEIPEEIRSIYRTAWELPMRSLVDMAAGRGAYIDQSQSLNLFMESPTIGKLSSMYMHAWKQGLKTTYYLRSRPATRINKTTTGGATASTNGPTGGGVPATPLPTREPAVDLTESAPEVAPAAAEPATTEATAAVPATTATTATVTAEPVAADQGALALDLDLPATSAQAAPSEPEPRVYTDDEALACSLENPESCEACQ